MSERKSRRARLYVLAACAGLTPWLGACTGGTDTGNPLTDLDIGACKSLGEDDDFTLRRSALSAPGAERFDGLECFVAQRQGETIELAVHNFTSGCYAFWDAEGRERDGHVDVVMRQRDCDRLAGCGSCLYDARFEVDAAGLSQAGAEAGIALIDQGCVSKPVTIGRWAVPPDGGRSLACGFASGAGWHAGQTGSCGQENMPCRAAAGICSADSGPECEPGLTCSEVAEHDSRCLKQCTSNDDCAVPAAMRCEDGICVL